MISNSSRSILSHPSSRSGFRRPTIDTRGVVIYPFSAAGEGLDVTGALVDALETSISQSASGNGVLNRLEAEIQLWQVLHEAVAAYRESP